MAGGGANIVASNRRKNLAGPSGWVRLLFFLSLYDPTTTPVPNSYALILARRY